MSTQGTVYDLGYAPHEGPRLGRFAAIRAIIVDGLRRALGLRRKPLSKVLPWLLIGAAMVPAIVMVTLTFAVSGFELEAGSPFASHADYFGTIGTLSMLFLALVTPTLLIPDRQHGVLAVYASRPVRAADYLMARATALAVLASLYILIPHTVLYIGISGLNVDGLWVGLARNSAEILPVLGSTVGFVIGYGAPVFLISIYVQRVTMASGVYVVAMLLSGALADVIPQSTELLAYKIAAPFALLLNPMTVRDSFFGQPGDPSMPLERVGFPQSGAAIAVIAVAALTAFLAHRRYRRDL